MRAVAGLAIAIAALANAHAQDLPGMAVGVLEEAKRAQASVGERNKESALVHIRQAQALTREIMQTSQGQSPLLVPVYRDTESTTRYTPVKRSKSAEMTPKRLKQGTSAREVIEEVTEGRLNVTAASDRLAAAETAVQNGEWDVATKVLDAIPQEVVETTAVGDSPIATVRQNLILARMRVTEGKYKAAQAPLRAAVDQLGNHQKLDERRTAEIAQLRTEIEDLAQHVDDKPADALTRIDRWINMLGGWNGAAH